MEINTCKIENITTKIEKRSKYLNILSYLLLFFIFFPYLTLIDTPWSLQPYALIFSIIILLSIKHKQLNIKILYLIVVAIFSIFIIILSISNFVNSIRSIANYISLPLIVWTLYLLDPTTKKIKTFVKISAIVYTIIGLIQLFIMPGFLTFLILSFSFL